MIRLLSGRMSISLIKYILISCMLCYSTIANASIAQPKISLSEIRLELNENFTIEEIFGIIETQTELSFSYHRNDIGNSLIQVMDFSSQPNQSIHSILTKISEQEKLTFKRIDNTINVLKDNTLETPVVDEEIHPIEGRVQDESGEGLPMATLRIKGTNIGTVTDIDGKFLLEIDKKENWLIVSYIGFKTREIDLSDQQSPLIITLELDIESLGEVVVVGYGKQKKETITGSIAKLESRELTQTKTANVANSLAGRLPGLVLNNRGGEPGNENMEIFIRGKATTGDASPLFVIDGVANRGTFERLNPDDIESISILKDASAAIYGAQAANGVILITTKRGVSGKPKFSYTNSFGLTQPARRQNLMGAVEYLTWIDEQNVRNNRPQIYQNVLRDYRDGLNNPNVWGDTDWWAEAMDKWSPQHQHSLNLSGGTEEIQYYISGQHLYQDANFKGSNFGFRQNNLRSNIDIQATSNLNIGLDLAGRFENRNGTGGVEDLIRGIYAMAPFESPYYENGLLRSTSKGNIIPGIDGLNGGTENDRKVYNTKLNLTLDLNDWVKGFSIIGFAAIDIINQERQVLQKPYDIYFLNSDQEYENLRDQTGNINLFKQFDNELSQTYHARLNYSGTFDKHTISSFVAYEQNQVNGEYISASRLDLVSEDVPFLFSGADSSKDNDGKGWQFARINYFGRLNYQYDGKYLLEISVRHDGSANFKEDRRFGTFPGISAGWRISEENFWAIEQIEELKIRASWGRLGNDRVSNFQYLQMYNIINAAVFGENPQLSTGLTPGITPNPNITWEVSEKTNLGIDLSLIKGILDLNVDAFYEKRSNILATRNASVPFYAGVQLPDENIGKTMNRGVEVSALHRRMVSNNFQYRIGGQFTYARNKILFIDESQFIPSHQRREGSPIDYLLVYVADGIYNNQEEIDGSAHFPDAKPGDVRFEDINDDGQMSAEDRILLPYGPTPRIVYGFSLGASWKGLEVNAFFQGQAGARSIYRPWDLNQDMWYFENRWISEEETPNALSPAAWDMSSSSIQNVSTIWVRKNHFLRIKNVEVSYRFPDAVNERMKVSNLRLFVSGFNLGFIYDTVKLYDPESRSDTGWYYPQQRVITAGLSVTI
jgi:TonB-dependent starch-binding outer membrane protein SusC